MSRSVSRCSTRCGALAVRARVARYASSAAAIARSPIACVDALEAAAGEARDDLGVAVRVGPERLRPLAVRAGLEQPRGAGVDHAVDEELRRAARASARPRAVAQRRAVLDLLVGRLGLERHRDDAAQREVAAGLELGDVVEQPGIAEHHVAAGEAQAR